MDTHRLIISSSYQGHIRTLEGGGGSNDIDKLLLWVLITIAATGN
jgi:hypothetical protein